MNAHSGATLPENESVIYTKSEGIYQYTTKTHARIQRRSLNNSQIFPSSDWD